MYGRFTQHYTWAEEVHEFLNGFGAPRKLRPRYNIAPATSVDVIRLDAKGRRELVSMRWGLVPFFCKKPLKVVPATLPNKRGREHERLDRSDPSPCGKAVQGMAR
jgi:putative SOS response-associated peptidase YedK